MALIEAMGFFRSCDAAARNSSRVCRASLQLRRRFTERLVQPHLSGCLVLRLAVRACIVERQARPRREIFDNRQVLVAIATSGFRQIRVARR